MSGDVSSSLWLRSNYYQCGILKRFGLVQALFPKRRDQGYFLAGGNDHSHLKPLIIQPAVEGHAVWNHGCLQTSSVEYVIKSF